ncbi:pentapeptide repeat-containing protein [Leptothoe sp. PORK10 BA2]|uniref:pentapeptide repeat-containing protein n=1 Tax=Leptothoe sp. PORK10 BA2 TaxID=3110254 RepID=UPI002B203F35|nr:pentapeptide repeat-containing protein [Leptothoe sp. PORK10 BA2]MEA5464862.1 pentapeptide repeat-containing protein [Leptothoe sp. PORK10 BA2]
MSVDQAAISSRSVSIPTLLTSTLLPALILSLDAALVDKARCKKGWAKTEKAWADLATTSKATLRRFWGSLKIQTEVFQAICNAVGLEDWESIAQFADEDDAPPKVYEKRLSFAIAGSIEEIDKQKLDVIVALLRKLGGDTEIEILDIEEGSVKLTLGVSEEALQRIQELFESGELQEVEGLLVQDVRLLTKQEIVESIRNNGGSGQNLSGADLSGADLSGANLSRADLSRADLSRADLSGADLSGADLIGANLSGANFSGADLSGANLDKALVEKARFLDTQGISVKSRELLIQRGAIFEDGPNSPDRVLVPR